jgi:hypothetical protein
LKRKFTFFICCIFFCTNIFAQNITGTWEGDMDGSEFLQLNIVQVGNTICGYSWDTVYAGRKDYCKANFSGMLSPSGKVWRLKFIVIQEGKRTYLRGVCTAKSFLLDDGNPQPFLLERVSKKPTKITNGMKACLPPKPVIKNIPPAPPVKKPPVTPPKIIPKKIDTVLKKITPTVRDSFKFVIKKPLNTTTKIPIETNGRINKEQSRIILNDKKIRLEIYDNGTIDGDIISVFFDDKKVVDSRKLSTEPIVINLELDETKNVHTLVLFAENLGSIPPNTALVIVTTGSGKRYELYSSATLNQNAALIFESKEK